jgi:hypothetical protein
VVQLPPGSLVIGDVVIPIPGQQVVPTLEAMAVEMAKQEAKQEWLVRNAPRAGVDPSAPSLAALLEIATNLLTLLQQLYGPGSYELAPVCEDRPPVEVGWTGGVGAFSQLNKKLDALADLLQAHKDMRQPVCATKASGQPVTVQFQEIG